MIEQSKENKNRIWNHENIMYFFAVMIAVASILSFGIQKKGYHVDEMFSYGLANSQYLPFLQFGESEYAMAEFMDDYGAGTNLLDCMKNVSKDLQLIRAGRKAEIMEHWRLAKENQSQMTKSSWVTGSYYLDYLTASENNRFNVASVYYNQRADVHPPLFYLILHTICSFFPGKFSKWFGIGLNLIYLLITLIVMQKLVLRLLGSEFMARLIAILYVSSSGFVTTGLYIRMYALLTMWVMIVAYLHVKLYDQQFQFRKKDRIILGISVLGGYLTHYYFVLYMIAIAMIMLVLIMIRKAWKKLLRYVSVMLVTGGIGMVVWPFSISHVFRGYRGTESLDSLTGGVSFGRLFEMWKKISFYTLGNRSWIICVVLFYGMIALILSYYHKEFPRKMLEQGILVYLPIAIYMVLVAQIVPTCEERYVMCVFPFIPMMVMGNCYVASEGLFSGLNRQYSENLTLAVMTALGLVLVIFTNPISKSPDYVYQDGQETVVVPEKTDCVFVVPDGNQVESTATAYILAKCNQIGMSYRSEVSKLVETYDRDAQFMVAVWIGQDVDEVVEEVRELFGYQEYQEKQRVYNSGITMVWLGEGE